MPSSASSASSRSKTRSNSSRSSTLKRRSILKKNGKKTTKKHVRIHSPRNQTRFYSLGSDEKNMKKDSPVKNVNLCGYGVFPCIYRDTLFENEDEWYDYIDNMRSRNESTGYRSIKSHRSSVMKSLSKQGKLARRIPEEYRLYNVQTGEIFDMRNMKTK